MRHAASSFIGLALLAGCASAPDRAPDTVSAGAEAGDLRCRTGTYICRKGMSENVQSVSPEAFRDSIRGSRNPIGGR
jgi:hypothetical protein